MCKYIDNLVQLTYLPFPLALSAYMTHEDQHGKAMCAGERSTLTNNVLD